MLPTTMRFGNAEVLLQEGRQFGPFLDSLPFRANGTEAGWKCLHARIICKRVTYLNSRRIRSTAAI